MGLFERWLEVERSSGRPVAEILFDLNQACGTNYKHNWISVTQKRPGQNFPLEVRRYMMRKVLPSIVRERAAGGTIDDVGAMTNDLT